MKKIALLSALLFAAFVNSSYSQIGIITTVAGTELAVCSCDGGLQRQCRQSVITQKIIVTPQEP